MIGENSIYLFCSQFFNKAQAKTVRKDERINPAHVKDIKDTEQLQ